MVHSIKKTVILCGGKGERLRPLTESMPKPLVPINGKPILSYIVEHLKSYNLKDFVFTAGYKAEKISEFVACEVKTASSKVIDSGDVDIITRIKSCKNHLYEDFIVVYGDTLSDVNIESLIDFHYKCNRKATMTLWPLRSPFGVLEVDTKGKITSYKEKPILDKWINIGYFCFSHLVIAEMENFSTFESFLSYLVKEGELSGYQHHGAHITVNTQKELDEAEKDINKLFL